MKKFISLTMCLLMILTVFSLPVSAEEQNGTEYTELKYFDKIPLDVNLKVGANLPEGDEFLYEHYAKDTIYFDAEKDGYPALFNTETKSIKISACDYLSNFDFALSQCYLNVWYSEEAGIYYSIVGSGDNNTKTIIIDEDGEVINSIDNYYIYSEETGNVLCMHCRETDCYILYNRSENTFLTDEYTEFAGSEHPTITAVKLNSDNKWYKIDLTTGHRSENPIPTENYEIYDYLGNGLYAVGPDTSNEWDTYTSAIIKEDGSPIFYTGGPKAYFESANEGLIYIRNYEYLHGFINTNGEIVVPFIYKNADIFYDGLAAVENDEEKWGFIDKEGNVVIPFEYNYVHVFSEGLAYVANDEGNCGFIDMQGNTIIPFEYNDANFFSEGLAAVQNHEGKWGYIDKEGNTVIPFEYNAAVEFENGTARVINRENNYGWVYINTINEIVDTYIGCGTPNKYEENFDGEIIITATGEKEEFSGTGIRPYIWGENKNHIYAQQDGKFYELVPKTSEPIETYVTITASGTNGTITGSGSYIKGSNVTVTASPNSGYNFRGWYINNVKVSDNISYTFTADADTEITAKFSRPSSGGGGGGGTTAYTVKFETNGANKINSQRIKKNGLVKEPDAPEKEGFIFKGWFTDKELKTAYDFTSKVIKSFTLYATWEEKSNNTPDDKKNTDNHGDNNRIILTINQKEANIFGKIKTNDVAPLLRKDRTMLPARFVAEELGAKVEWFEAEQKVRISKDDIEILIFIDSDKAYVNGEKKLLDSPAFLENERTYTPLRFIAENLLAEVEWNEETQEVTITKKITK